MASLSSRVPRILVNHPWTVDGNGVLRGLPSEWYYGLTIEYADPTQGSWRTYRFPDDLGHTHVEGLRVGEEGRRYRGSGKQIESDGRWD